MNLKVHNPCNEHTRYYRNYNLFWDELTDKLKEKYNVIENRYFENAHKERFTVYFDSLTSERGLELQECDYVIENLDNGDFYILSVSDDLSQPLLSEQNNPKLKKVLFSQFIDYKIKHHTGINYNKFSPWIYFQSNLTDLEVYYKKRQLKNNFIKKLYFRGNVNDRPILEHFTKSILDGPNYIGNSKVYFDELINYEIGLSIAGVGELCYRDIEYMALGIPFIRFEFQSELSEKLIPNYHYISIPYDKSIPKHNEVHTDRLGEKEHVLQIEARFREVIRDEDFLRFISKNSRKYYEDFLSTNSRINKTLKILNLDD
jgi:hypothetical protein